MMGLTRRQFLGALGGATAGLALPRTTRAAQKGTLGYPESFGVLCDLSLCVGCRRCEQACNEANDLPAPDQAFDDPTVLQHLRRTTESAYTVVNPYPQANAPAVHRKLECNHCQEPACASACPVGAFTKTREGAVIYNPDLCIGCRYCMVACPFGIPAYEYHDPLTPRVRKCTLCHERILAGKRPACVEACPMEALVFGKRTELLERARNRIAAKPENYLHHVYGEHEVGGTNWLYLSPVPFDQVGLPTNLGEEPLCAKTGGFLSFIPVVIALWPAFLGGTWLFKRHNERQGQQPKEGA